MPYPLPLTRTEAYLAYKAGVIQQSDLKPSLAVPRNGIDAWLAYWTGIAEDYPKREDGTPHILQEEEAYIAYLSGVINEYPEKCLRRVGAYLRYLISARWGRPDHPLNREELYLSLIKTQFIPSGDPSSDIEIDGTVKAPFVDVKMYGDTFQQSYEGKNLFDVSASLEYKWLGAVDGLVVDSSDPNIVGPLLHVTVGTTYVISGIGDLQFNLFTYSDDSFSNPRRAINNSRTTRTFTATTEWLRFSIGGGNAIAIKNNIQFEVGSTATSFEPYVGGQASPNPDYPQAIQTVTGEQTVTIVGKNKYPFNDTVWSSSQTASQWSFQNGSTNAYGANITDKTAYKFTLPAGTYTMTAFDITSNIINIQACTNGESSETIVTSPSNINSENLSSTITLTETTTLCVRYRTTNPSLGIGNTKIQIEKSETSTAYTPYKSTDYKISLSDNELEIPDGTLTNNGIECIMGSNSATITRTSANNNASFIRYQLDTPITIHSGETFTLYAGNIDTIGNKTATGDYMSVRLRKSNNTDDTNTDAVLGNINAKTTITATEDVTYTHFVIRTSPALYPDNLVIAPRLVIGQDNSIELCKLGTYQDYIYKDGDDWKVHKATGEITLNGSEGDWLAIRMVNNYRYHLYITNIVSPQSSAGDTIGLCSHFSKTTPGEQWGSPAGSQSFIINNSANPNSSIGFTVGDSTDKLADFKTWLADNTPTVLYALYTPTDTVITDQNLINQLNALKQGGAEEGTTYIKVSATDQNLPAKLYVEAPKYD